MKSLCYCETTPQHPSLHTAATLRRKSSIPRGTTSTVTLFSPCHTTALSGLATCAPCGTSILELTNAAESHESMSEMPPFENIGGGMIQYLRAWFIRRYNGVRYRDIASTTPARIRGSVQTLLGILKAARSAKFARHARVLETYRTTVHWIPVPISTLGDGTRTAIAEWVQFSHQLRGEHYPAFVPLRAFCFNDVPLCSSRTMRSVLCLDLFQALDR